MRWDRIGRASLLAVLLLVVYLYVGPIASWAGSLRESHRRSAEVAQLREVNQRLRERRDALRDPATLQREARRIGMIGSDERGYVIERRPGR